MSRISSQTPLAQSTPIELELTATSAPAAAKAKAQARPIPREPPVINAFFPRRLKLGIFKTSINADCVVANGIILRGFYFVGPTSTGTRERNAAVALSLLGTTASTAKTTEI